MAGVSVRFSAIDEISTRFEAMANAGSNALDTFDNLESAADAAFETVANSVTEASEAMENINLAFETISDNGNEAAEAVENVNSSFSTVSDTTEEAAEAIANATESMDGFNNEAEEATRQMDEFNNGTEEATRQMDGFSNETEEATRQSEEFENESTKAVTSLDEVLAAAGIVLALKEIGETFMECSAAAAEFESSIAMVSTIADSSVLSSEEISRQISALSRDTAQSVTDLAEATYGAISASVDTADAVAFVGTANKLAVGGFTSQATAVDVLTTAINAYGKSADDATQISDYLVTTQNLGKTTVDQLASSMGMVIPTAAAFNVELDNLSTAYAILTANGVQTAQSTTYLKAMFTELADTESDVAAVLSEKTGKSFAELMEQGYSLGDVMQILGDSVDGNTTAFMNMWSSMEAGSGAVSLYNSGAEKYADVLDKMQNSAGAAATAYETMTDTTEFSSQRMENSFNNLKIAIGDDLNPVISSMQNGIAGITDKFTDLITKHPAITATMTSIATALTIIVVGIGAYTAATKAAALATKAWDLVTKMNTATLAVTAIVAVTAAIVAYTSVMGDNVKEYDTWTNATREQYDELQDLTSEYENAVEVYGETSAEALLLKEQVDDLTETFEGSKQTIEEFYKELDKTCDAHDEIVKAFDETSNQIETQESGTVNLVNKLKELSEAGEMTVETQEQMKSIVDMLNESYPELGLNIDDVTGSIDEMINRINSVSNADTMQAKYENAFETYSKLVEEETALQAARDEAYELYIQAGEKYSKAGVLKGTWAEISNSGVAKTLEEAEEAYNRTEQALQENIELQQECTDTMKEYRDIVSGTSEEMVSFEDATAIALAGVKDALQTLAEEYDVEYQAAYDSIDGQIGLFDKMKTESEQSVAEMQEALQSQIEYINRYTENLEKATQYGLDENLISELSDGSAASAGQLDALIQKIEQLGGTTEGISEDAQAFIDSFNSSFEQVADAKETFANTVAEMETDFTERMDAINQELQTSVNNMNMADDAAAAARETLDSYINTIKLKVPEVNSALEGIKFANANTLFTMPVAAHADGGIFDEPHYGVFAEEGPESFIPINGSENSKAIWRETGRQLGMYQEDADEFYVAPSSDINSSEPVSENKTITLKLEGAGEMRVGSNGMSKEQVLNVLMENVKGVLMNIVQQEILEEGDLSYEF